MEERNVKITLETAKEWYNGNDDSLKKIALQAFNKDELNKPKLPKTWESWVMQNPYLEYGESWITENGEIDSIHGGTPLKRTKADYYLLNSEEQAESILTLIKLIRLRDTYRQGWKPDWDNEDYKWVIINFRNELLIESYYYKSTIFSFPTEELAKQFLENFKEELEQLKELL